MRATGGAKCGCEAPGGAVEEVSIVLDDVMGQMIAMAAAVAANCQPCLERRVLELREAGAADAAIRSAVGIGRLAKARSALHLKEVADILADTQFLQEAEPSSCPVNRIESQAERARFMLIAAGAAMAAGCEPCMNKAIPELKEAGVRDDDIRAAVEIGQSVKDMAADAVKALADSLTRSDFMPGRGAPGEGSSNPERETTRCA